jgi:hypothetical protein
MMDPKGVQSVFALVREERAAAIAGALEGMTVPHPSPYSWAARGDGLSPDQSHTLCRRVLAVLTDAELNTVALAWGLPTGTAQSHTRQALEHALCNRIAQGRPA